jgi:hypothetical protein
MFCGLMAIIPAAAKKKNEIHKENEFSQRFSERML